MRALKAVVLALGALCLGAFGVLVYLLAAGTGKPAEKPVAVVAAPIAGWSTAGLGLPDDAQVVSIEAVGELLAVLVREPYASDRIVFFDPRTGSVRGKLSLGEP